ncbi:inactive ubiquitin carboxyl-terminal hydrolase 53 [Pelomyxa schiedti]|nr:inactive ubiquitin carboxyl-terminal hydrolase 53 [Pelomyxa schiedti]
MHGATNLVAHSPVDPSNNTNHRAHPQGTAVSSGFVGTPPTAPTTTPPNYVSPSYVPPHNPGETRTVSSHHYGAQMWGPIGDRDVLPPTSAAINIPSGTCHSPAMTSAKQTPDAESFYDDIKSNYNWLNMNSRGASISEPVSQVHRDSTTQAVKQSHKHTHSDSSRIVVPPVGTSQFPAASTPATPPPSRQVTTNTPPITTTSDPPRQLNQIPHFSTKSPTTTRAPFQEITPTTTTLPSNPGATLTESCTGHSHTVNSNSAPDFDSAKPSPSTRLHGPGLRTSGNQNANSTLFGMSQGDYMMSIPPRHVGLMNGGQNNCFLNVVVQSLWNLSRFREPFFNLKESPDSIYTALKGIFCNIRETDKRTVSPNILRQALSQHFSREARFQLGETEDAREAFEAILTCLHKCLVLPHHASPCHEPTCISHHVFGLSLTQKGECPCGTLSSTNNFQTFVIYATIDYKLNKLQEMVKMTNTLQTSCVSCHSTVRTHLYLRQRFDPQVLTIGLNWPTPHPSPDDILGFFVEVEETLQLGDIFEGRNSTYDLRGMICFWRTHYISIFSFSNPQTNPTHHRQWIKFDDSNFQQIGTTWEQFVSGQHFEHPVLLFYQKRR